MSKDAIISVLENIARLLELKGENPFKIRAYLHAAKALETLAEPLEKLIAEDRLVAVDGIGKATAEKIATLSTTGRLDYYDTLRDEFPPDILTLFEVQGLGGKKIKVLWDTLKIHSITSLERACKHGDIAQLPGFGEKTATNILKAIEHMRSHAGEFRYGDIAPLAGSLLDDLRGHPAVGQATIAGSFRRKKEIVRDLDFLVSTKNPEAVMEFFTQHPQVENILAHGATKSSVTMKNGIQCDLRAVT
ncbi:MAG: helix-hairpin-helix domain-containing protein, partial [Verrucomicrobiota bacterium]